MQPLSSRSGLVGTDQTFAARVYALMASGQVIPGEGYALTAADVASVTRQVYDLSGPASTRGTPVHTATLTPGSVMFSPLQTDAAWYRDGVQIDTTGYSFRDTVPGSVFSSPGHLYRVIYTLTTTGGQVAVWYHEHTTEDAQPS